MTEIHRRFTQLLAFVAAVSFPFPGGKIEQASEQGSERRSASGVSKNKNKWKEVLSWKGYTTSYSKPSILFHIWHRSAKFYPRPSTKTYTPLRKHLEVRQKLSAARRIFNSLLGVWKCGQTRSFMFDVIRKTWSRRSKSKYYLCTIHRGRINY